MKRFGLYFLPDEGHALAEAGRSWLGWDVHRGKPVPLSSGVLPAWVQTPRTYGFHATLKPPFRLVEGRSEAALLDAVFELAGSLAPVSLGHFSISRIGPFLALKAPNAEGSLRDTAERCVTDVDEFRAPPAADELERRRKAGLDPTEEVHLMRWGYPYVLDRFRFHMTLSGALDDATREAARVAAQDHFAEALASPVTLDAISLVEQSSDNEPFELVRRFSLGR
jgi:hypothetical protein